MPIKLDEGNAIAEVVTFDEERSTGHVGARFCDDERTFRLFGVHNHRCDKHHSDGQNPEATASHEYPPRSFHCGTEQTTVRRR
jgi:hypothetical protein